MIKLLYITNIPAPYRQKRFNTMARIFPEYNIEFEVLYMAKIEPNRKWKIAKESYNYKYKIFQGIHPKIKQFYAHFNPGLLLRLLKNDYDIAIVGGMASPTHWLAPFFISKKKVQIMSVESNLYSVKQKHGLAGKLKKILLKKSTAYQVTGSPQIKYINYFYPEASKKHFIKLPNIIDEAVWRDDVNEKRLELQNLRSSFGLDSVTQMWILPARLIEIKGIIPFAKLLKGVDNVRLFILGDGELREDLQELIIKDNLPITLTGFLQQAKVADYYAAADLFVLPSIKDPSPLSPIEACAAGLPLLVSSRIGNLEDVLVENQNGWSYDPLEENGKGLEIVSRLSILSRDDLKVMGEKSLNQYDANFETEKNIRSYAQSLKKLL